MQRSQFLRQSARTKRRNPTYREWQLWQLLRRDQLGVSFRRQRPIGDQFILDFYCAKRKLAVEIDGPWHHSADGIAHDRKQETILTRLGVTLIRLPVAMTPSEMRQKIADYLGGDEGVLPATPEQLQTLLDGIEFLAELRKMPKKPADAERRADFRSQLQRMANMRR